MGKCKIKAIQTDLGTADLVTFTEEILNGKLHFLCSVINVIHVITFKVINVMTGMIYCLIFTVVHIFFRRH